MLPLQFADPKTPESTPVYTFWFTEPIASLEQVTTTPNTLVVIEQALTTPYEMKIKFGGGTDGAIHKIGLFYTLADGSPVNEIVHLLVQLNV